MNGKPLTSIMEALTKSLSNRCSAGVFNRLPAELAELFTAHNKLIDTMKGIRQHNPELQQTAGFDNMIQNLEANFRTLLDVISCMTGREILLHQTTEGETLWKISKKYNSDMHEISELNQIKNVILQENGILLLIPVKHSEL